MKEKKKKPAEAKMHVTSIYLDDEALNNLQFLVSRVYITGGWTSRSQIVREIITKYAMQERALLDPPQPKSLLPRGATPLRKLNHPNHLNGAQPDEI
jgi:hypothetical protein